VLLLPSLFGGSPKLGEQSRWKTSFVAELSQEGSTPTAVSLSGEWSRTVVAVRANGYDVRFHLASVKLDGSGGGQVDANQVRLAQERLSKPFWITCGADGSLVEAHFSKEMAPSDRNLLQTIATETQFVQGDGAGPVWTSSERDGGGSYLAIYQRQDATHVRKKKLKYLDTDARQSLAISIEDSEVGFVFSPDGAIAAVNGAQRIRLTLPGANGNSLLTRFEIHLSDLRFRVENSLTGLLLPKGMDASPILTQQPDPRAAQEDMDNKLLSGQSTDGILAAAAGRSIETEQRLAALFRRRPESIPLGAARLTGAAGTQTIAGALAEAGTPASVQVLGNVAQDSVREAAVRVICLGALAGMKDPSTAAMAIPVSLFSARDPKVRNAARLAGGALARAGREAHPIESDAIEADLAMRLSGAKTIEEQKELLSALGNSAGPRAFAAVSAAVKDPREDMRASATRSLRLVPGDATDALLVKTAKEDANATVRAAALFSMSFRFPLAATVWEAVLSVARSDVDANVRNSAISLVRNDSKRPPEAEVTLAWIAQHDALPALRRFAVETLAEIRSARTSK
jgi:hypothetical protein